MRNIFRPQGLILSIAFIALIVVCAYLFTDRAVKAVIETAGTAIVGAKVEVRQVNVSFAEQFIELGGLQITNPDSPMSNALAIERLAFDMAVEPLIFRRIHIDEMTAAGIAIDSPRETSGAIPSRAVEEKTTDNNTFRRLAENVALPSLELPSVDQVLKEEQLQVVQVAAEVESQYEARRRALEEKIRQLPTREDIETYKTRLRELKSKDRDPLAILAKAKELKQLKEDIEGDLSRVASTRREVVDTMETMREEIEKAKAAPQADIERIADKYGLSAQGLTNLTARLFGEEIAGWVDKGWRWYQKLEPVLRPVMARARERMDGEGEDGGEQGAVAAEDSLIGSGREFQFPQTPPVPDFLIKHIALSNSTQEPGKSGLSGEINNLSDRPDIWPHPIALDIQGENLGRIRGFDLRGRIDRRQLPARDVIELRVREVAVRDLVLSAQSGFPVAIESAVMNVSSTYKMTGGEMDLDIDLALADMVSRAEAPASSPAAAKAILAAVAKLDAARFKIRAMGDVENPRLGIESNLDNVLAGAVKTQLAEKTAEFKQKLRQQVTALSKDKLAALDALGGDMNQLLTQVEGKNQALDDLLKKL